MYVPYRALGQQTNTATSPKCTKHIPCRADEGLSDLGARYPPGLVHGGARMGESPDVLHCHDEVAGRLEQLHRLVVGDAEEAPAVHLQDLVSYLWSQDGVRLAGPGAFLLGICLLLPPSPTREELLSLPHHQIRTTSRKTRKKGQVPVAGDQALKLTASKGPVWRSLFRTPSQTNLPSLPD